MGNSPSFWLVASALAPNDKTLRFVGLAIMTRNAAFCIAPNFSGSTICACNISPLLLHRWSELGGCPIHILIKDVKKQIEAVPGNKRNIEISERLLLRII